MPRLACWSCGRQIYTVSPIESLFAEERRCPRCGAYLNAERRDVERRRAHQRVNAPSEPGPPPESREQRVAERRVRRRRRDGGSHGTSGGPRRTDPGWTD